MKKVSSYFKILALVMVGASFVACGNKDESTSRTGGGVPLLGSGVCGGCTGAGWSTPGGLFLGSGYGSSSFPMAMSIELVGDQTQITYLNQMQSDPSKTYRGQTYLRQAAINVASNITAGQCLIPAGTYSLTPTPNMGNYAGGSFVIPQFELAGANFRFIMALQQGAIVAPYVGGPATSFGAVLMVLAGPSRYNQQMVNCNDPIGFQLAQ